MPASRRSPAGIRGINPRRPACPSSWMEWGSVSWVATDPDHTPGPAATGTHRLVPPRDGHRHASPTANVRVQSRADMVGIGRSHYTLGRMDDLYRDYILEHYRRPHNFGVVEDADASYEGANPLCGDRITLMLGVNDGVVDRVGFTGRGCAISQASASLLTDEIKGKPLSEVAAHPRGRPARPARHRHQPGSPQVRDAQPRQPPARPRRSRRAPRSRDAAAAEAGA